MRRRTAACVLLMLAASACSGVANDAPSPAARESAVVYGTDNRLDVWAEPDAQLRALATSTAVAMIRPTTLRFGAAGTVDIRAAPLSAWDTFCAGTPFLDQPTAASCGAVLIDDDLLVTAGHCLTQTQSCRDFDYVFGYFESAQGVLAAVTRQDVYGCRIVAATEISPPDSSEQVDFAVVQLDRPVTGSRAPASLGAARALEAGEPLTVIGFPSGLPAKIDPGAAPVDPRASGADFFTLSSDTFSGSSGSGVYDAGGTLVGVFARGTADTVGRGDCRAVRVLADSAPTSGESATYVARATAALCAAGWPSQTLCGLAPRCGDGICSPPTEDAVACAADCPAPVCGDHLCEMSEWTTCPTDCGDRRPADLPDGWICDPIWYADGNTCDCQCGAPDPDCGAPGHVRPCDSTGPAGAKASTAAGGGCAIASSSVDRSRDPTSLLAGIVLVIVLGKARRERASGGRPSTYDAARARV